MCKRSARAAGLNIAAIGSTSTGRPSSIRKPAGVFIQALVVTTKTAETAPLAATMTPENQCASGGMRSQP